MKECKFKTQKTAGIPDRGLLNLVGAPGPPPGPGLFIWARAWWRMPVRSFVTRRFEVKNDNGEGDCYNTP